MKQCSVCSEVKPLTDFPVKDKWFSNYCKACKAKRQKEYYEKNKERLLAQKAVYTANNKEARRAYVESKGDYYKEKNREWYKANAEKNRIRRHQRRLDEFSVSKNDFPVDILPRLVEFYGTSCLNPNCQTPEGKPTLDHVVPLSKGGVHGAENFQVLCLGCNSIKGNRSSQDYRNGVVYMWDGAL